MTDDEMLPMRDVCRFFGGGKPMDQSTIYRWIREGRVPKPVRVGPNTLRWRRSELQKALDGMIAGGK